MPEEAIGSEVKGEPQTNGHGEVDSSLLARLRAQHKALSDKPTLDLQLPGYSLVASFKVVGQEAMMELDDRRIADQPKVGDYQASLNLSADVLIAACTGISERKPDGELVALHTMLPEWGDDPVVFDERLAELVGAELPAPTDRTARSVVFAVFKVYEPDTGNDTQLGNLSAQVTRWMNTARREADADF